MMVTPVLAAVLETQFANKSRLRRWLGVECYKGDSKAIS